MIDSPTGYKDLQNAIQLYREKQNDQDMPSEDEIEIQESEDKD